MNVICLGDSNTWGYDPRDFFGGPYCETWPALLQKNTGWTIRNWGENGREIPSGNFLFPEDTDLLILMLGTNDLLQTGSPEAVCKKMERFLQNLTITQTAIVLIAPPHMRYGEWVTDFRLLEASAAMSSLFCDLASRMRIRFADAEGWNIPIAYDGVHFTQQGHRNFSVRLLEYLNRELDL